jgi:hypothetical protein
MAETDTDAAAVETAPATAARDRLGDCAVCDAGVAAKYRCPGCAIVTCSLECSKRHKQMGEGCSGKRKVAEFKDIRDFTDADLVSDYRFLEDALLEKDRAKRWRPRFRPGSDAAARADRAPAATRTVDLLTQKAADRGVQLFCMPDGMARRVANTTFYDRKRDLMQWRVEWLFHGPCAPRDEEKKEKKKPTPVARAEDAKVDETATIGSALRAHFAPGPGNAARLHELRRFRSLQERTNKNENENENETSSIGIFLAAEGRRADDPRFHRLALDSTLRENLNGKRVLEFPTLHVAVLPEDQDAFPLVPENE